MVKVMFVVAKKKTRNETPASFCKKNKRKLVA